MIQITSYNIFIKTRIKVYKTELNRVCGKDLVKDRLIKRVQQVSGMSFAEHSINLHIYSVNSAGECLFNM